jgi:hypothetical protein
LVPLTDNSGTIGKADRSGGEKHLRSLSEPWSSADHLLTRVETTSMWWVWGNISMGRRRVAS